MKPFILRKFAIFPLALLMAAAPVLCCCWTDVAEADMTVESAASSDKTSHCHPAAEGQSAHQAGDCECPQIQSDPVDPQIYNLVAPVAPWELLDDDAMSADVFFPLAQSILAALDPGDSQPVHPAALPLYILHHNLRI